jgi:hypothetical protein
MTIYAETIFLPKYGVEIDLVRTHGRRWVVAGSMDMVGNARERMRRPKPRGAVPVTAYMRAEVPWTWPGARRTPRAARPRSRQHRRET